MRAKFVNEAFERSEEEKREMFDKLYKEAFKKYGKPLNKGEYIGTCRAHDCDKNAYKRRKEYNVYIGTLIFYDQAYDNYRKVEHVFNVNDENEVVEFTELGPNGEEKFWSHDTLYFGKQFKGKLKDIWNEV